MKEERHHINTNMKVFFTNDQFDERIRWILGFTKKILPNAFSTLHKEGKFLSSWFVHVFFVTKSVTMRLGFLRIAQHIPTINLDSLRQQSISLIWVDIQPLC